MKVLRRIAVISCLSFLLLLLTSCSGYNSVMRKHLSDEENYDTYHGRILDLYYIDEENNKVSLLSADEFPKCDVVMKLSFDAYDTVQTFSGHAPSPEISLDEHWFLFDITEENHRILVENGFYDAVAANTPIEITASSFLYMDGEFFFIAAVNYDGTTYLQFEDGLQNIKAFINERKSLL